MLLHWLWLVLALVLVINGIILLIRDLLPEVEWDKWLGWVNISAGSLVIFVVGWDWYSCENRRPVAGNELIKFFSY